ncbi:hypothetical protein LRP52_37160 [Photobacterium sp. ZSDE20]|uniref:Uncharacterized protein n=1 Tax=Photobacterium pectinilyticum TaxID=2906793 RepID=A0ABT1N791_9GAMM|nr:hypothetical protein [Photobacterium sp. ZSDE20]MCQ1060622.1 hypothetical protein [Photobacterium sp. ZSDE20]MDD1827817.1 hypothetical protein [Photobacterium sp. ZSDE20]
MKITTEGQFSITEMRKQIPSKLLVQMVQSNEFDPKTNQFRLNWDKDSILAIARKQLELVIYDLQFAGRRSADYKSAVNFIYTDKFAELCALVGLDAERALEHAQWVDHRYSDDYKQALNACLTMKRVPSSNTIAISGIEFALELAAVVYEKCCSDRKAVKFYFDNEEYLDYLDEQGIKAQVFNRSLNAKHDARARDFNKIR